MQIVCIDDEALVLGLIVSMCKALPQQPAVEGFRRAGEALDWLQTHAADILLLDINMPVMDGQTLAARIRELLPEAAIIFLTGHAEYAVDAFAMHADGYLLKPISPERLAAEIDYVASRQKQMQQPQVLARTFGNFEIFKDGKPVTFSRTKAKELLAFLIDRQGAGVTRAEMFATLWENGRYDRSMQKQLDVIIRSLRSTLEAHGIGELLEMRNGLLRVRPELLSCDLYRFLSGDEDAIHAYRGEYMNGYSWAQMTEGFISRSHHRQR